MAFFSNDDNSVTFLLDVGKIHSSFAGCIVVFFQKNKKTKIMAKHILT